MDFSGGTPRYRSFDESDKKSYRGDSQCSVASVIQGCFLTCVHDVTRRFGSAAVTPRHHPQGLNHYSRPAVERDTLRNINPMILAAQLVQQLQNKYIQLNNTSLYSSSLHNLHLSAFYHKRNDELKCASLSTAINQTTSRYIRAARTPLRNGSQRFAILLR